MATQKRYIYKAYKNGVYQGDLPKVVSDFGYSQDINTAGTEITVDIGATLDSAGASYTNDIITDSSGAWVVDDIGNPILASETYSFTNYPIDVGNEVQVWLYYENAPNGVQVFDGIIISWQSSIAQNKISLSVQSYGVQLDNYFIGSPANTALISNTTSNQETVLDYYFGSSTTDAFAMYQYFYIYTPTNVGSITLKVRQNNPNPSTMNVTIIKASSGATVGSTTASLAITTAQQVITASYGNTGVDLQPGLYYFGLSAYCGTGNQINVASNTPSNYADGYMFNYTRASGGTFYSYGNVDLYFTVTSGVGTSLTIAYNSYDPAVIAQSLVTAINTLGSKINGSALTIDTSSSTVVSYTFRYNTYLEGIQKCLELAPANWYWYVDVGTNSVNFHARPRIPNHTFTIGKEIEDLDIGSTIDQMKNRVAYSGGMVNNSNLLVIKDNTVSQAAYGYWLDRETDSRVTLTDTANILASSILNQSSTPSYRTTVTILASTYDIETILLGQMIRFRNTNSLTTSLLLQIIGIDRNPDKVKLRLDSVLPTQAHRIEDIKRNLDENYTINNPGSV